MPAPKSVYATTVAHLKHPSHPNKSVAVYQRTLLCCIAFTIFVFASFYLIVHASHRPCRICRLRPFGHDPNLTFFVWRRRVMDVFVSFDRFFLYKKIGWLLLVDWRFWRIDTPADERLRLRCVRASLRQARSREPSARDATVRDR